MGRLPRILTTNQSVKINKKDYYVTQYLSSALLAVWTHSVNVVRRVQSGALGDFRACANKIKKLVVEIA